MRLLVSLLLVIVSGAACAAGGPRYQPMPSMSQEDFGRLTKGLAKHPPRLSRDRLPPHFKIGRCLLRVDGKRLISGRCAYMVRRGGEFEMHGPRHETGPGMS